MIKCIYPGRLPITYDKESAPAQKMNTNNMIKADLNTFDCKIGQTTNYSTKFFSMLCNYDRESREYKELTERIKLLRRYIGDSIDAGKGVKQNLSRQTGNHGSVCPKIGQMNKSPNSGF